MTATAPSEHPFDLPPRMTGLAEDDLPAGEVRPAQPGSWRLLPAAQQPEWPDPDRLATVTAELAQLPPLVFAAECDQLTERLAVVVQGEAFVLQGGDCAETFAGSTADAVRAKLQTLLQMAVVLTYGASVPVVKIGRMAGQFAKPRSKPTETRNGTELPAYRGDAVNGFDFTRTPGRPTLTGCSGRITARPSR
ncbi:MAG TPA: 3-deoxy-7-phosphoheptulonate synthase [Streptosporangiaceae bacterium]